MVRSQSGRVIQNTLTDGATTNTSAFSYDGAGRLVTAVIPRHTLSYAFAGTGGCGGESCGGRNGNRTSFTDVLDAGTTAEETVSTAYCYDGADRLTSAQVAVTAATVPPVAPPTSPNLLETALAAAAVQYDLHGNTVTLADQSLGWHFPVIDGL